MRSSLLALASLSLVVSVAACGGSDDESLFSSSAGGAGGSAGSGTAGTGTAGKSGSGTAGTGTAGTGTAGTGTAGTGTAGTGTAGTGTAGTGTAGTTTAGKGGTGGTMTAGKGGTGGTGTAGSTTAGKGGTGGTGTAGTGTAGTGTAGTGTAGTGTAGTGTAGTGTAGTGTAGTGTAGTGTAGTGTAGAGGSTTTPTGDTCNDPIAVKVDGGMPVQVTGDTSTAANDYSSGNNQCGGSNSNELVYAVTVGGTGTLTVAQTTSGYSGSIYVLGACGDTGTMLGCQANPAGTDTVNVPVKAGETYYVFADGFGTGNQAGKHQITFTLAVCGDGVVDANETCDDKNNQGGDGCSPSCQFEAGGTCDIGNKENNGVMSPQAIPDQCLTAVAGTGSLSGDDQDWFCQTLIAGEHWQIGTFVNTDLTCNTFGNHDTVVEVYQGVPGASPTNYSCSGSTALACDDDSGSDTCSFLDFTVPSDGKYCARVVAKNKGAIQFFNTYFIRR